MILRKIGARLLVALALTGLLAAQLPFTTSAAFAAPDCGGGDSDDSKVLGIDGPAFVGGTILLLAGYGVYTAVAHRGRGESTETPTPTPTPEASPTPAPAP